MDERAAAGAGARGVRSGCGGGGEARAAAARPAAPPDPPTHTHPPRRGGGPRPPLPRLGCRARGQVQRGAGAGVPPPEGLLRRGRAAPAPA